MSPRKLTDEHVRRLRAAWQKQPQVTRELARQCGISRQSLRRIALGHAYKEIKA